MKEEFEYEKLFLFLKIHEDMKNNASSQHALHKALTDFMEYMIIDGV